MTGTIIRFVNYTGNDAITRKVTVIDGVPFYCSSGTNSGWSDTWFPFLGLEMSFRNCGWFRKPGFLDKLSSLPETISQYNEFFPTDDIRKRFTSLKCLLISSNLGGGYWETENGITLLSRLREEHPDFYEVNYDLQDSHTTFDVENIPARSVDIKKIYRKVNELLEEGAKHPLSEFDANLFYSNFVQFGFAQESLCPIPNSVVVPLKPDYPEFPTQINPPVYNQLLWPSDYEKSLDLTNEQKEETERYIRAIYPSALEKIKTRESYRNYSTIYGDSIKNVLNENRTYLNIKILNNGEIIVYPYNIDVIYKNTGKNTLIFKVYNLSCGEWFVLKNQVRRLFIPYLMQLKDRPHIARICDFTGFNEETSQIEKLYDKNFAELLSKSTSISIEQKEKYMLSLLDGFNTVHQIPYRFNKSTGYLSHADIKYENIFYDEKADDLVIGDFGESGKWEVLTSSTCFISPELALEYLKFQANSYSNADIISFNKTKGQTNDIWNLGLVFAGMLGGLVNHDTYRDDVLFPNLKFILDRLQPSENKLLFMGYLASLEQEEIDDELNQIKQKLPQTSEGIKLRHLWEITHQMLQVSYQKRPSCRELLIQMQNNPVNQATAGLRRNSLFSMMSMPEPAQQSITSDSNSCRYHQQA